MGRHDTRRHQGCTQDAKNKKLCTHILFSSDEFDEILCEYLHVLFTREIRPWSSCRDIDGSIDEITNSYYTRTL
jgi:predicted metal-binding protein